MDPSPQRNTWPSNFSVFCHPIRWQSVSFLSRGEGSRALHTSLIFEDIQWNWRKSPRMNCWVFLLILTFRTVTYKLPQPRPPVCPPPVGRSPPGVSNTALLSSKKSRHTTDFSHCTGIFVLPHFQAVMVIWQQIRGAEITLTLVHPSPI